MKLSNKEKQRISDLYKQDVDLKIIQLSEFYLRAKSLLYEQTSTLPPGPSQYSWSSGYSEKSKIVNTDPSGAKVTIPSKPSEYEQKKYTENLQQRAETLHNVLFYTSFVLGLIPHPIALGASVAIDYIDAANYYNEGDYENAGLMATLATTGLIMIPILNSVQKGLRVFRQAKTLKNVGDKLKKGSEGLKTLTKSEMEALDAISDSKNLQAIYNGMNEYSKQQAQRYLMKPELFRKGYAIERFEKQGIRMIDVFYDDMSKRGVNSLVDMGVIGGMSLGEMAISSQLIFPQYIQPVLPPNKSDNLDKFIEKMANTPEAEFEDSDENIFVTIKTNQGAMEGSEKMGYVKNLNKMGKYGPKNNPVDVNLYEVLKDFQIGNTKFVKGTIVGSN